MVGMRVGLIVLMSLLRRSRRGRICLSIVVRVIVRRQFMRRVRRVSLSLFGERLGLVVGILVLLLFRVMILRLIVRGRGVGRRRVLLLILIFITLIVRVRVRVGLLCVRLRWFICLMVVFRFRFVQWLFRRRIIRFFGVHVRFGFRFYIRVLILQNDFLFFCRGENLGVKVRVRCVPVAILCCTVSW